MVTVESATTPLDLNTVELLQAAMDLLQRYRWKGNIRELRNTVERLIIMTPGDTIDLADLPGAVRSPSSSPSASASAR